MRSKVLTQPRFQFFYAYCFVRGIILAQIFPYVCAFVSLYLLSIDGRFNEQQVAILKQAMVDLGYLFGITTVVLSVVFFFLAIFLSHRQVGPLIRVQEWLALANESDDPGLLKVRGKDEIAPVAAVLNRLILVKKRRPI